MTPQPLISQFTRKLSEDLGDNITSVLVYGSAADGEYVHGVSDINIAVILKDLDLAVLKQCLGTVRWGHKNKIATPLFLTKDYILNSLDVFPIEFMGIKEQHKLVSGEDVFKDLQIPLEDIRLLCEQQIKGKLLNLRQAYLNTGGNPPALKNLLAAALNDLLPVFRQLIALKGQKPLKQKEEMLGQLAGLFALDIEPLAAVFRDKARKSPLALNQVEAHLHNFLSQLEKLSGHLDTL